MPKVKRGRLDGVSGMETFTASELHTWADKYEAQIKDPCNPDDPKWLQRRADKLRQLAIEKARAVEIKAQQAKNKQRKIDSTNKQNQAIAAERGSA